MPLSSLTAPLLALFSMLGGFNYQFGSQTDANGTAWVELSSDENLDGVKVEIKGSDGNTVSKTVSIKAGKPTKITWKQKDRKVEYEIEIEANEAFTNGSFEVVKPTAGGNYGPLVLVSDRAEIVDGQKIRYKTPFTATSLELKVYNTDGDVVVEKLVTDQVIDAGETFELSWNTADEVFMVEVTAADDTGSDRTEILVPWSIDVPHTEVNFDSGKSIIKPEEEHKVADVFAIVAHEIAGLDKAAAAVGQQLAPQLYIVGYTDTVGNAGDNQKLSEARAKAIAQYFFDKGIWCEINYAGMGERGLAVSTGDSVDEVRNRRALYILDMQKPGAGGQVPSSWKKLSDARARMINKLPELPESYVQHKEAEQAKRRAKFGGGDSGSTNLGDDDGPSSGDGDSEWGNGNVDSGGSSSGGDADGGPPAVVGDPGATKKGCAVEPGSSGSLGLLAGLFGLLGLRRRRRAG